ncbi:Flp pilus assembly protein CpaB [Jiangella alkaliphila]|uniref:Flp pilus assembly protein CpaB n=1 Tax=Jiangella alkaliphila TaxID=419479 RepID=A0A1H2IV71_9ACTN|nr:Flp pilus assembly protein CpaB [Jiangella alkaliphila]SDU47911.1 Flp pilus assembly protein CpaB [Jiangella alkaliphila]
MDDPRSALQRLIRAAGWHRRLLAGGLAAAAVAFAIQAASPAAPATVDVVVAARDLAGGAVLTDDDVRVAALPPDAVPAGVVPRAEAAGALLAAPVRAGEPITDRRLLGPGLLEGWGPDVVAAPVRVADAGAAGYLRPGDRIDLLATALDGAARTDVVASEVPVLAVPSAADAALAEGALVLVAASPDQAAGLAAAAVTSRLSFTVGVS